MSENVQSTPALEAAKLKEQLRKWLDETSVKSACAFGLRNYLQERRLVNPRVHLVEGSVVHAPTDVIQPNEGSSALFTKREYAMRGTTGCLCYDIADTEYMISVMWSIPLFSEKLGENKFNVRCLKTGECNENLYKFLNENARRADGEVVQEENGFRLCACMGREPKSLLIIDLYQNDKIGPMKESEPIRCGRQLESRLREWLHQSEVKNACAVGINNLSTSVLASPHLFLYSGECVYEPPKSVESQMGSPSLFCKREFSLLGTSGVLTYDIKDTTSQLAILWYIPLAETLQDNRFFAGVISQSTCDESLYRKLWKDARRARDGEAMREDSMFQVFGRMETTTRALLVVNFRPARKQWSLW